MTRARAYDSAILRQAQERLQARQTRLKDQLKAIAAFPKELRRALPVYNALCNMSDEIPCTMGKEGHFVLDDLGKEGRKEFETAQDTIDNMIVAIVIYVERVWSASFGLCLGADSDWEDAHYPFWDACPNFYEPSQVDGGWPQYAAAWRTHASHESTARRGKTLIDNWKRERIKARRAVDRYKRWWESFWKRHPELAAEYEPAKKAPRFP